MGLEAEEAEMTEGTIELAHSSLKHLLLEQDAAAKRASTLTHRRQGAMS